MIQTVEVEIDAQGGLHLKQNGAPFPQGKALLVWDDDKDEANDGYLLSEAALAKDWLRPEEDEAWAHLLQDK